MNTPISFEIAKLLKEKGFLETCEKVYRSDGLLYSPMMSGSKLMHSNVLDDCSLSAPTITEVVMWLYEKYGIWISVSFDNKNQWYFNVDKFGFSGKEKKLYLSNYNYNSPTEAYEAAIEYVLTKLI